MTPTANTFIATFEHDVNVSATEKTNVFKMLQTILQNLITKEDEKFRQLRLSNMKIQNLIRHSTIFMLLTQVAGFTKVMVEGEEMLKVTTVPPGLDNVVALVAGAYQRVSVLVPKTTSSHGTSNTSESQSKGHLTEKQKARLLAEQKLEREKQEAREARKRTAAQIQADKYVRENDANWKPQVNAAAAKSGTSISTFRDKYGES